MRSRILTSSAFTLGFTLLSSFALAAPIASHEAATTKVAELYPKCAKSPSASDVEGAKGAHKAAQQFFARGEFDRAISYWGDAYGFDCSVPQVFVALAGAYDGAKDPWMAVAVLELYRERDPSADKADLEKKIADYTAKAPKPKEPTTKPTRDAIVSQVDPPSGDPSEPTTTTPFGPAPWITFGVGAAAIGAGVVVAAIGVVKIGDAEDACPTRVDCDAEVLSLGNQGNTLAVAGAVTAGIGGALAVGSLIWQFAANGEEPIASESGVSFTVAPVSHGALAGVHGAF